MSLTAAEREAMIARYAAGPAALRTALALVPEAARQWRPAPDEFSVHEVICHCADSELNAAARLRYLLTSENPTIVGYDPGEWARVLRYHDHPLTIALATVEAVRKNTLPIISRLPEEAWARVGTHTESGRYTVEDWLGIYAAHLEEHTAQVEGALAAWTTAGRPGADFNGAFRGERR